MWRGQRRGGVHVMQALWRGQRCGGVQIDRILIGCWRSDIDGGAYTDVCPRWRRWGSHDEQRQEHRSRLELQELHD
eukprot:233978-Prymnesium_polylepis.1